jgi:hypothetical protein
VNDHTTHDAHEHEHEHGPDCGHVAIQHGDHTDYVHEGHLHHPHEGHVDEHVLDAAGADCTPDHDCAGHNGGHAHAEGCGHEAVPHGDHVDFLVEGHLHHPHGEHCDAHGELQLA